MEANLDARLFSVALVIAILIVITGCGGTSNSSNSSSSGDLSTTSNSLPAESPPSGQPSAEFLQPEGKDGKNKKAEGANRVVRFGDEASEAEREAAGHVLEENLEARAAADFQTQCDTLSLKAIEGIYTPGTQNKPQIYKGREAVEQCTETLAKLAKPLAKTKQFRENPLQGPVAAVRVKKNRGFCLFHGKDGRDYVMPVEKESGEWKVGAILTEEL